MLKRVVMQRLVILPIARHLGLSTLVILHTWPVVATLLRPNCLLKREVSDRWVVKVRGPQIVDGITEQTRRGVQPFDITGPHWKKQTLRKMDKQKKVLSKFMILCWAIFRAILSCVQPAGHSLDTPGRI